MRVATDRLFDLSECVAVVTGSGRGIGLTIARRLLEAGAAVLLVGRVERDLADLVDDAGLRSRSHYMTGDLTRSRDVEAVVHEAQGRFGSLDILVNNAGEQPRAAFLDSEPAVWDLVSGANVRSVILATQAAARVMAVSGRGGSIVNIASVRAIRPGAGMAPYSASKAAVVALTQGAAVELGPLGIRVNAISPGLIERSSIREEWPTGVDDFEASAPLRRIGSPLDVADACLFLASPAARWITGVNLIVDGGITLVR